MPVYLFTFHAYGSWMPDHKDGFTQQDKGYQPTNPAIAYAYREAMEFPPFEFDHSTQRFMLEISQDVCHRRGWKLHHGATERTHLHDLVGWRDEEHPEP